MTYIQREANQLVGYVANMAIHIEDNQIFWLFKNLPSTTRKITNIDKHQVPSFRIKTNTTYTKVNRASASRVYITLFAQKHLYKKDLNRNEKHYANSNQPILFSALIK